MQIRGIEGMTPEQINDELNRGGRFVIFYYTISVLIMTFKNPTDVYFVRAGEGTMGKSIGYTLLTFLLGWWGFPWGPIYSLYAIGVNFGGGQNVTGQVIDALNSGDR
jgi:hypothetical protein